MLLHLDLLHSDLFTVLLAKLVKLLFVVSLDFADLATNEDPILGPLCNVHAHLFEDQDSHQIGYQCTEITHPVCNDVVGDV